MERINEEDSNKRELRDSPTVNEFSSATCEELEDFVSIELSSRGISPENQEKILEQLQKIKEHNLPTYLHSLRVGLLATQIGSSLDYNSKPLLLAGLLHDFGKTYTDNTILDKKTGFSEEDYSAVKNHVRDGYNFLKDIFPFSAEVFVRHHAYGPKPYPETIPKTVGFLENHLEEIDNLARLLTIIDFYDASLTRNNDKNNGVKLTRTEIKFNILNHFPDMSDLIKELYKKKLLT